jgi:hypothetical protein
VRDESTTSCSGHRDRHVGRSFFDGERHGAAADHDRRHGHAVRPATRLPRHWQTSGGISDSGSFVKTELHPTGALANSPVVGVFQAVIVFTGSRGTFTVAQQSQFTGFPEGTWQVQSGSGDYARVSGHGTFAFTLPNNLTFTGVISKAG